MHIHDTVIPQNFLFQDRVARRKKTYAESGLFSTVKLTGISDKFASSASPDGDPEKKQIFRNDEVVNGM